MLDFGEFAPVRVRLEGGPADGMATVTPGQVCPVGLSVFVKDGWQAPPFTVTYRIQLRKPRGGALRSEPGKVVVDKSGTVILAPRGGVR